MTSSMNDADIERMVNEAKEFEEEDRLLKEKNPEAETEEYNTKKNEVEDVVKPIIANLYFNGVSPDQEEDLGQYNEL
jgi:molecular chaperone DnaK (HSP70)